MSVPEKKFKMWSKYPFVVRDISVQVPENVSAEEVKKVTEEAIYARANNKN